MIRVVILTALALAACAPADGAPANDRPDGPIADRADIIPAAPEAKLEKTLREFQRSDHIAFIVLTIPSLDGQSIEALATNTYNRWRIGDAVTHRGLLLLVAPTERKVRIEVGCRMEVILTNEEAAQIIQNDILPLYRSGDLAEGTIAGAEQVMAFVKDHASRSASAPLSAKCSSLEQAA